MLVHCEGVWFLNISLLAIYTFLKLRGVFKKIPTPIQLMQPGNMESMTHPQLLRTRHAKLEQSRISLTIFP